MHDQNDEFIPEPTYPEFDRLDYLDIQKMHQCRLDIQRVCNESVAARMETYERCKADSLYWLSMFCYLYEPRPMPKILYFIPWEHQVPGWKTMERYLGHRDIGLEKSRAEGASWLITMLLLHKWLFVPMFSAGMVSKDEASADTPDNLDSLFAKIDWQLTKLPAWMLPRFDRKISTHTLFNLDIKSSISAFSCTGDVGSGGRKTVFFMDEVAKFSRGPDKEAMNSTQYITNCRIFASTPKGPDGAYFDLMNRPSNIVKVILDWQQNPVRKVGMYQVLIAKDDTRSVKLLDRKYWTARANRNGHDVRSVAELENLQEQIADETRDNPFDYAFMLTGPYVKHAMTRSPWYDNECRRPGSSPTGIAQELDRDYGGSRSRFFDFNMIQRLQKLALPPVIKGDLRIPSQVEAASDLSKPRFQEVHSGRLSLWFHPDLYKRVPQGRQYVIGCDVALGTGGADSTNSTAIVVDRLTGRMVAEFATPNLSPSDFCDYVVSLGYWFGGPGGTARIIWEANGCGQVFSQRITSLGYTNVHYRGSTEEMVEKETKKIGFWTSPKTKAPLLGELQRAMQAGEVDVTSYHVLEEMKFYVVLPGGKVEHIAASTESDPSSAGDNHGDRVVAIALAWWVVKDYVSDGGGVRESVLSDTPPNSLLGRRLKAQSEKRQVEQWVPSSQRRHQTTGLRR